MHSGHGIMEQFPTLLQYNLHFYHKFDHLKVNITKNVYNNQVIYCFLIIIIIIIIIIILTFTSTQQGFKLYSLWGCI